MYHLPWCVSIEEQILSVAQLLQAETPCKSWGIYIGRIGTENCQEESETDRKKERERQRRGGCKMTGTAVALTGYLKLVSTPVQFRPPHPSVLCGLLLAIAAYMNLSDILLPYVLGVCLYMYNSVMWALCAWVHLVLWTRMVCVEVVKNVMLHIMYTPPPPPHTHTHLFVLHIYILVK